VAGGHPVAQVERPEQRGQQGDLEARQAFGLQLELVGALLGDQQRPAQVLEDDEGDSEQRDRRQARLVIEEGEADDEQGGDELGRQHRKQDPAQLRREAAAVEVAREARDRREVDRDGEAEGAKDQEVGESIVRAHAEGVDALIQGHSRQQRRQRVGEGVYQQVVQGPAKAKPARQHRRGADQSPGGSPEDDRGDDHGEEACRDLDSVSDRVERAQVGGDREREQDDQDGDVPVAKRRAPDRDRDCGDERERLDGDRRA
jgi:hypothetical protein